MIYCYLSDGALAPLITKTVFNGNELFGSYEGVNNAIKRSGVCQMDERVLSIFSNDESATAGGLNRQYHNLVRDPRGLSGRRTGLFTGESTFVTGTGNEYAYGQMELHFDKYWAELEAAAEPGNAIYTLTDPAYASQFTKLFNVIETVVLSHVFDSDPDNMFWKYKSAGELDTVLKSNTTLFGLGSTVAGSAGIGYCPGSLTMSELSVQGDKRATVQNRNSGGSIKTEIGTNTLSKDAPILFPDYFQFAFKFSGLTHATWFRIYLNPDYLLDNYAKCRITDVICPAAPADMVNLNYGDVLTAISATSNYVANLMTGTITKTTSDVFLTTNHTGASAITLSYHATSAITKDVSFTCVYKGHKPTVAEMRNVIKELLETARGGTVEDIFPDLYLTTSFVIVPMYNTRVTADTNLGITYCRNIINISDFLKDYNGHDSVASIGDVPFEVLDTGSFFNIPGYFMHTMVYSLSYDGSTPIRLGDIDVFKSFQPISTEDQYWGSLSDEAKELSYKVTKIIAAEINNTVLPSDVSAYLDTKEVFTGEGARTYWTFTVAGFQFSIMRKESFYNSTN